MWRELSLIVWRFVEREIIDVRAGPVKTLPEREIGNAEPNFTHWTLKTDTVDRAPTDTCLSCLFVVREISPKAEQKNRKTIKIIQ